MADITTKPLTAKEVVATGVSDRHEARRIAARNRDALPKESPEDRIKELDKRFGKGKGATRERYRLSNTVGGNKK